MPNWMQRWAVVADWAVDHVLLPGLMLVVLLLGGWMAYEVIFVVRP